MIDSPDRENKEKTTLSPPLIPPKKEESQKKSSLLQKLANKLERISKIPERGKKEVEIIRFIEKVSQLEETPEILLVKAASLEHYSDARYSIVAFFLFEISYQNSFANYLHAQLSHFMYSAVRNVYSRGP